MTLGELVRKLRKLKGLTQQEFADRIGIKRNSVATYEIGQSEPIGAVVSLICREFHVNETWLRTGEGEMFLPRTMSDEISSFVEDILRDDSDFRRKFISVFARMSTDEWKLLEAKVLELAEEIKKADP